MASGFLTIKKQGLVEKWMFRHLQDHIKEQIRHGKAQEDIRGKLELIAGGNASQENQRGGLRIFCSKHTVPIILVRPKKTQNGHNEYEKGWKLHC